MTISSFSRNAFVRFPGNDMGVSHSMLDMVSPCTIFFACMMYVSPFVSASIALRKLNPGIISENLDIFEYIQVSTTHCSELF